MTKKANAFTIVELLIVIVVIAILAAVSIVAYRGIQDRAAATTLQADLRNAATQLALTHAEVGTFPGSESALNKSSGTNYEYTSDGSTYCLTATAPARPGMAYHVSNAGSVAQGACSGHSDGSPIALSCPSGFIIVPGNSTFGTSDFCVMKYEAKNVGGTATSQAAGVPWVSISQVSATSTAESACSGCRLISEAEWMTIAANVLSVASNWNGGVVGSSYIFRGHSDNAPANLLDATSNDNDGYFGTGNVNGSQRRTLTLTNGEVIWDFAGNAYEWTSGVVGSGQQAGTSGDTGYVWREFNNGSLQWNGMPASSRPSAISSEVGGYTSLQGIGQLYSYYNDTSTNGYLRSGHWGAGNSSGVLALRTSYSVNASYNFVGFRVTK